MTGLMRRHRHNYWSGSAFAKKILDRPGYASGFGWKEWQAAAKKNHRLAYWFVEDFLDAAQNVVYFPYDLYRTIKDYLYNRFVHQSHMLRTGLTPGEYHPVEERILHGMFTEMVEFIEVEMAHMKDHKGGRSVENGLAHLAWEVSLGEESPRQSATAIELIRLYQWWTKERPARPDAYEASGLNKLARYAELDASIAELQRIENAYDTQDTDMLISLIRIRKEMWT